MDHGELLSRRKLLKVSYAEVLNNMNGLHDVGAIIHRTILPDNIKILGVHSCMKTRDFIFELCHESFDVVGHGAKTPSVDCGIAITQTYNVKPRSIDFIQARDAGDFD